MTKPIFTYLLLLLFTIQSYAQEKNQITYIANEGIYIECKSKKVLIDALHKPYRDLYQATKPPYPSLIINGNTPFEKIDLMLVTHIHGDHFDSDYTKTFLEKHEEAILVAPQQVIDTMGSLPHLEAQIYSLQENSKGVSYEMEGVKITTIPLIHSYPKNNHWVQNMAYLLDFEGITILHLGDAELVKENFDRIQKATSGKVDYALLPYWLFYEEGKKWIKQKLKAKKFIAIHVPKNKADAYKDILKKKVADIGIDLNVFMRIGEFEEIGN